MNKIARFFSLIFYCTVCFSSAATLFLFALQCCNPILGVLKLPFWKRLFNNPELAVFTVKPFVVLGLLACIFITYVFKCYLTKQQRKILWLLMRRLPSKRFCMEYSSLCRELSSSLFCPRQLPPCVSMPSLSAKIFCKQRRKRKKRKKQISNI